MWERDEVVVFVPIDTLFLIILIDRELMQDYHPPRNHSRIFCRVWEDIFPRHRVRVEEP